MKINIRLVLLTIVAIVAAILTAVAEARTRDDGKTRSLKPEEIQARLQDLDCPRPKPRVAIYSFNATGKLAAFEGYNVGDGLAAQLATELTRTGCFIVLDRTGLSNVLREQEMTLAGVVNRETGARAGHVIGAEVIIKGTVTEFEPNKRGRGLTLGLALPNTPLGIRLGRNGATAHVALDLSIVDATTGRVKFAHRVEADSKSGGWTIGLDFERGSLGGDTFSKSPLGVASRNALGEAILHIADDLQGMPWRGQVVDSSENMIFLNAGLDTGIRAGDTYRVSTVVRTLIDPSTGLVLDNIEREVGRVRVVSVKGKYSIAEPVDGIRVKRGDYVHL